MAKVSARDPEPVIGTRVRDSLGRTWVRFDGPYGGPGAANWIASTDVQCQDPESWTKVAGNYGPVTVLR